MPVRGPEVSRTRIPLVGDHDVAVQALVARLRRLPGFVALTGTGPRPEARYSIFAAFPVAEVVIPASAPTRSVDPWAALNLLASGPRVEGADDLPFVGGVIAYLSYDLRCFVEAVSDRHSSEGAAPLLVGRKFGAAVVVDRDSACAFVIAIVSSGDRDLDDAAAVAKEQLLRAILTEAPREDFGEPLRPSKPKFLMSRKDYLARIEDVVQHLYAGDVYQVNFTYPVEGPIVGGVGAFYERLVRHNPAPFGGLFRLGDDSWIASASPERFLRVNGRDVTTRPIKGTAARGRTPESDAKLGAALLSSEKDRAELAMITDLLRNDLARSCESGSVRVEDARALESYATVHHLVATVAGRLREQKSVAELLRDAWPGGSISGVPKVRAMSIIDRLEVARRGFYTGSLGYISWNSRSDWNLLIRSAWVNGDSALTWVGGGITVLSNGEQEWAETLHKLQGIASAAPWSIPEVPQ